MKKTITLSLSVLAICFASCRKDRTCVCTTVDSVTGVVTTRTTKYYKSTKRETHDRCYGSQTTTEYSNSSIAAIGNETTCQIK